MSVRQGPPPARDGAAPARVEVALPVPVPRTFTYEIDAAHARPGVRVRVPFAGRRLVGWVTGPGREGGPPREIRAVERVLDAEPVFDAAMLRLCRWIANYYLAPLGVVLRAALPAVLSNARRTTSPVKTERLLRLVTELPTLTSRDEVFGRSHRQRECFETLESLNGSARVADLTGRYGFSMSVLRGLVKRGLAEFVERPVVRDPFADIEVPAPPDHVLTAAQRAAVERLTEAVHGTTGPETPAPHPFLLLGVTGSGKTRVYIELLREVVVRQGRGAIVLVPEIALTPQTVARFRAQFGDDVAVLHSALSDGERYDAWRALASGARRIAIGARSAVFAPLRDLGAIIVDEEHEASYKQGEAPRYHAREVAIMRTRMARAICVLGSATPALESWHNAQRGKFTLLELPERAMGRPLPPVRVVDLRRPARSKERTSRILSPPLAQAIGRTLERGEQTILLLNRRGYATFVQCRSCGEVFRCGECNVSLTWHRARRRLVCHYCFREEPTPVQCGSCASADLSFLGVGTEQVEREVADGFPHARVARMDVDTTSARWSHHEILDRVERREVDILLGTQMIAKGLDFPGVTLVGVVNADVAMNLPDFRATERTFQLLTQVAGRAGRGPAGGEVLIQTALPGHYAITAAISHDYGAFVERELAERRPARYPPHTRMTNAVLSGLDERAVQDAVTAAAAWTEETLRTETIPGVLLTGPAPCPIDRIRGRWRWHFLLRSERAGPLAAIGRLLQHRYTVTAGRAELRLVLDRDPVTLL